MDRDAHKLTERQMDGHTYTDRQLGNHKQIATHCVYICLISSTCGQLYYLVQYCFIFQLQTTIKATVHYPARLPPLKHERSPESSNLRPPLLTKPIGNGEEREESGDLVDNRMRKEHRSRELTESIRQRMRQKLQEAKRGMPEDETGDQQVKQTIGRRFL